MGKPPRLTERGIRRRSGGPFVIRNAREFRRYNDTRNADLAKAKARSVPARTPARTGRASRRRGRSWRKTRAELKLACIALALGAMFYGLGALIA